VRESWSEQAKKFVARGVGAVHEPPLGFWEFCYKLVGALYQSPRTFHQGKPTPNQMMMLTTETSRPSFHFAPFHRPHF
jgi:hypothetical protein